MRSLDLDGLRTFLACCDAASFAEAGLRVNKSQSGVSMQMRTLTETVGQPLFERQGRKNVLSPAGLELKIYAQRLVRLNDEAIARFRPERLEGRLRVGTPDDYAGAFLPDVIGWFGCEHPRVEVAIESDRSAVLAERVRAGTLDLAVLHVDAAMPGVEVIHTEPLVWVAPTDRPLEASRPLPVAMWPAGCIWREVALTALDKAGIESRTAYTGTSISALATMVEAGLAVSALPRRFKAPCMRHVEEGALPSLGSFDVGILRSESRPRGLADAFADQVIHAFQRLDRGRETMHAAAA